MAIANGHVSTNWQGNTLGSPGRAGQYTLGGAPTGVSWGDSPPAPGTILENLHDGTSDGIRNYLVQDVAVPGPTRVVAYDLQWQNPTALFAVSLPRRNVGITYDPIDNAL